MKTDGLIYVTESFFKNVPNYYLNTTSNIVIDCFISNLCNLSCKHCYFGDTQILGYPLSTNQWISIIDSLIKKGVKHFHFSGKEPLCNNEFLLLLEYISCKKEKNGLYYGFISNGTTDNVIYSQLLETPIDYIEFSIEGLESYHDYIREKGGFNKIINLIKTIDNKIKINTVTTLSDQNKDDFIPLTKLLIKHGVKKIFASPLIMVGNAKKNSSKTISETDYLRIIQKTIDFVSEIKDENVNIKFCITDEYVLYSIQNNTFLKKYIIEHYTTGIPIVWKFNNAFVELNIQFINIPYSTQLIITNDGYVLPTADSIHHNNYDMHSLCNIKKCNIEALLTLRGEYIKKYISKLEKEYNFINNKKSTL